VAGTITSSLGGPIAGVKVTVAPTSGEAPAHVITGSDGKFSVDGVSASDGNGKISLADLPATCADPGDLSYTGLSKGNTVTRDIEVTCRALAGAISGTVTSSLGGPLAGVHVSVDPEGDAPAVEIATGTDGRYSATGIPVGGGTISLAGVPDDCSLPPTSTYTDLEDGETKTIDFSVPCELTTGALTVTVSGLVDFDASVRVTGPGGFDTTLTKTSTIANLQPGTYTVSGLPVVVRDPVVRSEYVAFTSGSPSAVAIGDTASAAVSYATKTGSGGLWFASIANDRIARFAAGQLQESGSPLDTTSVGGPPLMGAAAFDKAGNLWVSSMTTNKLVAYGRAQLVGGGTPAPFRTLDGALAGPVGMAFDDDGNLWVSNVYANSITAYSAAQLAVGGTATPIVTITSPDMNGPDDMAFDAAGDLWVVSGGNKSVVKFSKAQLASGGAITPAVKLTTPGAFDFPSTLAFDVAGNLWVANRVSATNTHLLVSFDPGQLAAGGTPAPAMVIDNSSTFIQATSIAFDESGGLWVSVGNEDALYRFSAEQLATGGFLIPSRVISLAPGGSLDAPSVIIFDPTAEGLPIR